MGEKENMKSVRISDETYTKIVRNAKKNRRTISGTIELLIEYGMQVMDTANMNMSMNMGMGMGMDMAVEEPNEEESKPVKHYAVDNYEKGYEMTEEELFAMNKKFKESRADI